MKQHSSPRTSKPKDASFDLSLLISAYDAIGLTRPEEWKKMSARELSVIKNALRRADKFRSAAWDPGAAYLTGVMDVLTSIHSHHKRKPRKVMSTHKPEPARRA